MTLLIRRWSRLERERERAPSIAEMEMRSAEVQDRVLR